MIYLEIWSEAWLDIALWHTCTSLEALAYSRVVEVSTCGKARPHAGQRSEMIYLEIWSEAWLDIALWHTSVLAPRSHCRTAFEKVALMRQSMSWRSTLKSIALSTVLVSVAHSRALVLGVAIKV
jgi:hypothetical protein